MIDDQIIDAQLAELPDDPVEAEFNALVDKLVADFPTITSKGFDLKKIKGNLDHRSGKAMILHLTLAGWTVAQIASSIGCEPQTVHNNLVSAIREAAPLDDVEDLRTLEILRLNKIDQDCELAWLGTLESTEERTEREPADGGVEITTKTLPPKPNPAFKKLQADIVKIRAALSGLNAPTKHEVSKDIRKVVLVKRVVDTRAQALAAQDEIAKALLPPPEGK